MSLAVFDKLRQVLLTIDRPGFFCTSGSVRAVQPTLEVAGVGPIRSPLTEQQAKELKKHCEQAPYGKGEETLIDTSVRRVWRMTPDRFTLTNPDWEIALQKILKRVQKELGLERQKLESHLYDLLLYEPGSFFLPHRDGEKLDRMVATLVVVLPSSYQGGELVIQHNGEEQTIDIGGDDDLYHIHFIAFYADCEHEVRRLHSGHRLCLVYNLTLPRSKKLPLTSKDTEHIEAIRQALSEWVSAGKPQELVITLEHQYTRAGLTWDTLKGTDRIKARVLAEGARRADCQAHLGLLSLQEEGQGDDDEVGEEPSDYEMYVERSFLQAKVWIDGNKGKLALCLDLKENAIVDAESLHDGIPEVSIGEYTGNMGMDATRWYEYAAIFLWPNSRHFNLLCEGNHTLAQKTLERLVRRWERSGKKDKALRTETVKLAAALIRELDAYFSGSLLRSLIVLNETGMIASYLKRILLSDNEADLDEYLPALGQKYGWGTFQQTLYDAFARPSGRRLQRNLRLLEHLCLARPREKSAWRKLCQSLAAAVVTALERTDRKTGGNNRSLEEELDSFGQFELELRVKNLVTLNRLLIANEQFDLLSRVLDHIRNRPEVYSLTNVQIPALAALKSWLAKNLSKPCPPLSRWLAACRERLETLAAQKPQPFADFCRPVSLSCTCPDCNELKHFLHDPYEETHLIRVNKPRYRHLKSILKQSGCDDLDLEFKKGEVGHVLICTKNSDSYDKQLREFQRAKKDLKTVRNIQQKVPC